MMAALRGGHCHVQGQAIPVVVTPPCHTDVPLVVSVIGAYREKGLFVQAV